MLSIVGVVLNEYHASLLLGSLFFPTIKYFPNTNNSVEGMNSILKGFAKIYKGLRPNREAK